MKQTKIIFNLVFISLILLSSNVTKTEEYVYPVAKFNDEVCVIYQSQYDHIELWFWNPSTKALRKALLSYFIPAGLQVLPGEKGFSVVDNDCIRVKFPDKRSPKRVDTYSGLYDVSVVHWLDSENCYLGAKMGDNYGIFQINTSGDISTIVRKRYDCMYPQKVDDSLFYIERLENKCRIASVDYSFSTLEEKRSLLDEEASTEYAEKLWQNGNENSSLWIMKNGKNQKEILPWQEVSMSFLNMASEKEGFFLETPSLINRHDEFINFTYHHIKKEADEWKTKPLFDFSIPAQYLLPKSNSRVYESILPFLPVYKSNGIVFINSDKSKKESFVDIFFYDLGSGKIRQKTTCDNGSHMFCAPLPINGKVFHGGQVASENLDKKDDPLFFWINDLGNLCLELPYFDL
ncbi:hypothetical protein HN446_03815 [bacterium]|jgi:hypothetical protein|nr:hypothetical protein [bacterium]